VRLGLREAWLLVFYAIPFGIGIGGNASLDAARSVGRI
jgi:hypothetical protein